MVIQNEDAFIRFALVIARFSSVLSALFGIVIAIFFFGCCSYDGVSVSGSGNCITIHNPDGCTYYYGVDMSFRTPVSGQYRAIGDALGYAFDVTYNGSHYTFTDVHHAKTAQRCNAGGALSYFEWTSFDSSVIDGRSDVLCTLYLPTITP